MKYFFLILATTIFWVACKNDVEKEEQVTEAEISKATTPSNVQAEADQDQSPLVLPPTKDGITKTVAVFDSVTQRVLDIEKPINPISTAIGPNPLIKKDPVKPVYQKPNPTTPQESRVVRVLTKNYWVVWGLLRINDREANRYNQGTWFKLNEDGTYEYGFLEKKIGSGAWIFDGHNARLRLDSEIFGDDRDWRIMINNEENQMVWSGVPDKYTTDIQFKLENFLFIPKSRQDIGLPE